MSHVLYAYEVTVRRKNDSAERLLGNFDDAGSDLLAQMHAFFEDPDAQTWVDAEANAAVEVHQVYGPEDTEPRAVAAMVNAGESGVSSEIRALLDGQITKDVAFRRMREHVEFVKVLVLAALPGARSKGFLIAHSPSGRGVKTRFWETFKAWFAGRFPDFVIEMNPCAPEGFYRSLAAEGDLKRVMLVRQLKPADRVSEDDSRWFEPQILGRISTVVSPVGRLKFLRKQPFVDALGDDDALQSLLTLRGETYDEIRTTFRDRRTGREHSIVMSAGGLRTPRAGYDVTDQIEHDGDGDPTYASLRAAALGYLDLLRV